MLNIKNLRKEYHSKPLDLKDLESNPFKQFESWFQEAVRLKIEEPNAMILATVSKEGHPSSRVVLLKQVDTGFVFFTNYKSQKGQDLEVQPFASLTFYWKELKRQIHIAGFVKKTSRQESEDYFHSRPRSSQIAAWASRQSEPISDRDELEKAFVSFEKQFEGRNVDIPSYWGGFRLLPVRFEFWQGRESRLHDRYEYCLEGDLWHIQRLSP